MSWDPRAYSTVTTDVDGNDIIGQSVSLLWCRRCGAAVADPELHDRWHGAMDK